MVVGGAGPAPPPSQGHSGELQPETWHPVLLALAVPAIWTHLDEQGGALRLKEA